jgi:hypothetical protein
MFCRFFFHVRCAITIGAGCIGAPLVLADYTVSKMIVFGAPQANCLLTEFYRQETEIL